MPIDDMTPFNGDFLDSAGVLHNIDGGVGMGLSVVSEYKTPFYGVFIGSDGQEHELISLLGSGGGGGGGGGAALPNGGTTGQALVKTSNVNGAYGWADIPSSGDIAALQNEITGLTTDNITEGTKKYYDDSYVDARIGQNHDIMLKSAYAINGAIDEVDHALTADKLTNAKILSINGDITGSVSTDFSSDAQINAVLGNVGTAGTYTKVTTDAKGRITQGAHLQDSDIPNITLAKITDAGTAANRDIGLSNNQIPVLDSTGKLPTSVLPSLTTLPSAPIFSASVVADLITLTTAVLGSKAVLADGSTYILVANDYSIATNWRLLTEDPTNVKSVNGFAGPNVVLTTTEISEGTNLYYTDNRMETKFDNLFANKTVNDLDGGTQLATDVSETKTKIDTIESFNGIIAANTTNFYQAVAGVDYAMAPTQVTASLNATNWSGSTYTLNMSTVSTNTIGFISVAQTAGSGIYDVYMDARLQITGQQAGSITITARGLVPIIDIPVIITLFR